MAEWQMDYKQLDSVTKAIQDFGDGAKAEKIINNYLVDVAVDMLKEAIQILLPASGRNWKGKKRAASATDPFRHKASNLVVRIYSKKNYEYLYFPDDGATTKRHRGNQQFMKRGAMSKSEEIGKGILSEILKEMEIE